MGKEAERSAIFSCLASNWPTNFGPLAYPNVPFQVPSAQNWGSVDLLTYDTSRVSLGGNDFMNRTYGALQVDLFCPSGVGTRENKDRADWIEEFFDTLSLTTKDDETIQFQTPESRSLTGTDERREGTNSNWSRYVVTCPFYRDTIRRK